MHNDDGFILVFMLCVVFCGGCLTGGCISNAPYKEQALKRGYAVYHPVTGEFTWKEDLKNEDKP